MALKTLIELFVAVAATAVAATESGSGIILVHVSTGCCGATALPVLLLMWAITTAGTEILQLILTEGPVQQRVHDMRMRMSADGPQSHPDVRLPIRQTRTIRCRRADEEFLRIGAENKPKTHDLPTMTSMTE